MDLKGKCVLLGVSGGIAASKTAHTGLVGEGDAQRRHCRL